MESTANARTVTVAFVGAVADLVAIEESDFPEGLLVAVTSVIDNLRGDDRGFGRPEKGLHAD
jgi:hypothetical protein